ncbi:unnamed protein product [Didymodactylos carnosus]|uniref:NACHT domain-containing protein n=1 Tax=Didymodactylos carnosus TaxID=1234261 RepID=A0A814H4W1_9BILA|nr:unnamed protein product [Didymodactylos carnosus]CAF1004920.1 unnamed protein product [Didymodactylos carnosus]CAF3677697.1 unnamed protein product [Didymodactylos carnosus]CAF3776270.1 unnamed protein product [Didymodactylos carnosus]
MTSDKSQELSNMVDAINILMNKANTQKETQVVCQKVSEMKTKWEHTLKPGKHGRPPALPILDEWFELFSKSFSNTLKKTQNLVEQFCSNKDDKVALECLKSIVSHLLRHGYEIDIWISSERERTTAPSSQRYLLDTIRYFILLDERREAFESLRVMPKSLLTLNNQYSYVIQPYIQKCIFLHQSVPARGLVENVQEFLNHYTMPPLPLSSADQTRLQNALSRIDIPLNYIYMDLKADSSSALERKAARRAVLREQTDDDPELYRRLAKAPLMPSLVERDRAGQVKLVDFVSVLQVERWLVILGDPGSGKTTFVRWLTFQYANAVSEKLEFVRDPLSNSVLGPARMPILIRVGELAEFIRFNGTSTLFDYIGRQTWMGISLFDGLVGESDARRTTAVVQEYVIQGRALVILDGLDEIPASEHRRKIVQLVREFVGLYILTPLFVSAYDDVTTVESRVINPRSDNPLQSGGNQLIVTSRIVGYYAQPLTATHIHQNSPSGLIEEFDMKRLCKKELTQLVEYRNDASAREKTADEFVRLICEDVGVLAARGEKVYGFLHLTFQEYFTCLNTVRTKNGENTSVINLEATTMITDEEISEVIDRFLYHVNDPRFREPLFLALGWISWKPQFDEVSIKKLFAFVDAVAVSLTRISSCWKALELKLPDVLGKKKFVRHLMKLATNADQSFPVSSTFSDYMRLQCPMVDLKSPNIDLNCLSSTDVFKFRSKNHPMILWRDNLAFLPAFVPQPLQHLFLRMIMKSKLEVQKNPPEVHTLTELHLLTEVITAMKYPLINGNRQVLLVVLLLPLFRYWKIEHYALASVWKQGLNEVKKNFYEFYKQLQKKAEPEESLLKAESSDIKLAVAEERKRIQETLLQLDQTIKVEDADLQLYAAAISLAHLSSCATGIPNTKLFNEARVPVELITDPVLKIRALSVMLKLASHEVAVEQLSLLQETLETVVMNIKSGHAALLLAASNFFSVLSVDVVCRLLMSEKDRFRQRAELILSRQRRLSSQLGWDVLYAFIRNWVYYRSRNAYVSVVLLWMFERVEINDLDHMSAIMQIELDRTRFVLYEQAKGEEFLNDNDDYKEFQLKGMDVNVSIAYLIHNTSTDVMKYFTEYIISLLSAKSDSVKHIASNVHYGYESYQHVHFGDPSFVEVAAELVKEMPAAFCAEVQRSSFGEANFKKALYCTSIQHRFPRRVACIEVLSIFGQLTVDMSKMFVSALQDSAHLQRAVFRCVSRIREATREAIEYLYEYLNSDSMNARYTVAKLLVNLAHQDVVSVREVQRALVVAMEDPSAQQELWIIKNHEGADATERMYVCLSRLNQALYGLLVQLSFLRTKDSIEQTFHVNESESLTSTVNSQFEDAIKAAGLATCMIKNEVSAEQG